LNDPVERRCRRCRRRQGGCRHDDGWCSGGGGLWIHFSRRGNRNQNVPKYDGGSDSLDLLFWPHRQADKNVGPDGQKDFQHPHNSHNPALIHPENYKNRDHPKQQQSTSSSNTHQQSTSQQQQVAAKTIARAPNEFMAIPCCHSKRPGAGTTTKN
jgi:hypothetical protein